MRPSTSSSTVIFRAWTPVEFTNGMKGGSLVRRRVAASETITDDDTISTSH